jgi:hypothetical protein
MLSTEQENQLANIIKLLLENQDKLLKDFQPNTCGNCNGGLPKYVFRNPSAYKIGQMLEGSQEWLTKWINDQ